MTKFDTDNLSAPHTQRELGAEPAPAVDVSTEAVMRLLNGVTPGPWAVDEGQDYCDVVTDYGVFGEDFIICERANRDVSFIAASRDLVPALLARAEAAEAKLSEWQQSQQYRYIGKDGKPVLARALEDRAEAAEAEVARLRDLLCLADEVVMLEHGCFPLDRTNERQIFLNDACTAIRSVTGDDYRYRKARADAALRKGGAA